MEENESLLSAMAHLEMLYEAAIGEYKPKKPDELQKRKTVILSFFRTGRCKPEAEDFALVEAIRNARSRAEAA